ncbi:MAG: hypothetical protein C0407_09385 [Desulfobacca sp.]|nr:hypothetical protein [Desulfobacca sp.]
MGSMVMKNFSWVAVCILAGLLCFGCAKKSGIEGKVLDGKGRPLSGLKLIVKQVQPVKGYEQFETTTGADGSFRFKGLFPASEYSLFPWDSNWKTESKLTIYSDPEGQMRTLPSPMVIRFTSRDGAITDSKTGFQWAPDPGQPMNWKQAQDYAQNLKLSVYSDWRLPTRAELRELFDKSSRGGIDPAFLLNGPCVWSSEMKDPSSAWIFYFNDGKEDWTNQNFFNVQVLAVRSALN